MYNESFRSPLEIRYPAKITPKQQVNQFTLNLDIAPAILDYAGVSIPTDMQGASIRPLLQKGKVPNWRKEIYYHYYELSFGLSRHYGIYTGRYKLMHFYNPIDAWELYDLKKDKLEMNNVYDDPGYSKVVRDLKGRLRRLQLQYKDDIVEKAVGSRQWAVGSGQWAVGSGQWAVGSGGRGRGQRAEIPRRGNTESAN